MIEFGLWSFIEVGILEERLEDHIRALSEKKYSSSLALVPTVFQGTIKKDFSLSWGLETITPSTLGTANSVPIF